MYVSMTQAPWRVCPQGEAGLKGNFFPLGHFGMISKDSFPWSFGLNSEFIVVILVHQF